MYPKIVINRIKRCNWKQGNLLYRKLITSFLIVTLLFSSITVSAAKNEFTVTTEEENNNKNNDSNSKTSVASSSEVRAMWISFLEFDERSDSFTESAFRSFIDTMYDNCVNLNMNTVIVHVRPFSDAFYPSSYYPWSSYISGVQGRNPGYDPLEYMVEAAHKRGLQFHAWINPYRVLNDTDMSKVSSSNPASKWLKSSSSAKRRNVLTFDGKVYLNPAKPAVQKLIINGVKEIVENYDVDGIHFDDYFYPSLGEHYATNFDYTEYKSYVSKCIDAGKTAQSIVLWRRNNVNKLVKKVYAAIKDIDSSVVFGISPAGNINNLYLDSGYYVDVKTWMSSNQYIDYICPQIYWTFTNSVCPYTETVNKWLSYKTSDTVDMYIGIGVYRAGSSVEPEWANSNDVLKRQINVARNTKEVDGFYFFRYNSFYSSITQTEVKNLLSVLK